MTSAMTLFRREGMLRLARRLSPDIAAPAPRRYLEVGVVLFRGRALGDSGINSALIETLLINCQRMPRLPRAPRHQRCRHLPVKPGTSARLHGTIDY